MTVRGTWAAVVAAVLWSVALLAGAAAIPAYSSGSTLVEANGSGVLVVVAVPLAASLVVAVALLRPRVGWFARGLAWCSTGVVGLLGMLAILTIGIAILPVALLLATACALDLSRLPASAAG